MNKVKLITIIAWTVSALAMIGLVIFFITGTIFGFGEGGFGGGRFFGSGRLFDGGFGVNIQSLGGSFDVQGEHSVPTANIDTVDVRWVAGEVRVTPHDGENIIIIESAQRELRSNETLRYAVSGSTLRIDFRESGTFRGRMPAKNLEILVPRTLSESMELLRVDTVSNEIIVTDITAQSLRSSATSARVNVSGTFNDVNLNNVSGNITLNNLAENSRVEVDTVSGSTDLTGRFRTINVSKVSGSTSVESAILPYSLNITGVSGRVDIRVPADDGSIAVNHSAVSGRLTSEIPMTTQGGNAQFRISTVSGNTTILPLD